MERFEASQSSLITNARCLIEGVDIPAIDCVLFADPKRSTIDIVQAVGRGLRLAPDTTKERCYVIVPVLVDQSEDSTDEEAFGSILSLLRSLAAQDEQIIAEFKAISEGKRPSRSIVEWPEDSVAVGHDINLKDFPESIEPRIYPKLVKLEWLPFEEARAFVHTLELKGAAEWNDYSAGRMEKEEGTRPPNIPANTDTVYKDTGWISMPDWLGYKRKK